MVYYNGSLVIQNSDPILGDHRIYFGLAQDWRIGLARLPRAFLGSSSIFLGGSLRGRLVAMKE